MKTMATALAAVAVLALAAQYAPAQQQVLAINQITVPANADALVSVPVPNEKVGEFTVDTVTSNGIADNGASFETDQYQDMYYVRIMTGDAAGLWSTISSNSATELVLDNTDVHGMINAGDTFCIYKHQTIGSIFPDSMFGTSFVAGTKVLIFSNDSLGINRSSDFVVEYQVQTIPGLGTIKGWNGGDGAETVLAPETRFGIRNSSSKPLSLTLSGSAPDYPVAFVVPATIQHDLMVSSGYPVPIRLASSGLGGIDGRKILVYDNAAAQINKSADAVVEYQVQTIPGLGTLEGWNGGQGAATMLNPSESFTIRVNGEAASKIMVPKPY